MQPSLSSKLSLNNIDVDNCNVGKTSRSGVCESELSKNLHVGQVFIAHKEYLVWKKLFLQSKYIQCL